MATEAPDSFSYDFRVIMPVGTDRIPQTMLICETSYDLTLMFDLPQRNAANGNLIPSFGAIICSQCYEAYLQGTKGNCSVCGSDLNLTQREGKDYRAFMRTNSIFSPYGLDGEGEAKVIKGIKFWVERNNLAPTVLDGELFARVLAQEVVALQTKLVKHPHPVIGPYASPNEIYGAMEEWVELLNKICQKASTSSSLRRSAWRQR